MQTDRSRTIRWTILGTHLILVGAVLLGVSATAATAGEAPRQWSDDDLVGAYSTLAGSPKLDAAILEPKRPHEAPNAAFLEALAWYADGQSASDGTLSMEELDGFLRGQVAIYRHYLEEKVAEGVKNDYARTRMWKVIQKMSMLRDQMLASSGEYRYGRFALATAEGDPWEREHTLTSLDDFRTKVCDASAARPVLVKYGNTNCTQCLLFELTGSIQQLAETLAQRDAVDVYKVWYGMAPDETFDGRIPDPALLNDLAKQEGVTSSPTFIVYRNGRRYPCGDAFPDRHGEDEHLQSCLTQSFAEAPVASPCDTRLAQGI